MSTPTPRTDALDARIGHKSMDERMVRHRDHARQLETELAACRLALRLRIQRQIMAEAYHKDVTPDACCSDLIRHLRDLETPLDVSRL
jgi:hypothetical protein